MLKSFTPETPQEYDLQSFLDSIQTPSPIQGREIGNNFFLTELGSRAAECYRADPRYIVLLSFQLNKVLYPLAIFYFSKTGKKFGNSSLLIQEYGGGESVSTALREATEIFFKQMPDQLLGSFGPEWNNLELKGVENNRILLEQEPQYPFLEKFLKDNFSNPIRLPVFPSVYHFNNPYLPSLIALGLDEITPKHSTLIFGCGAGLEAALLAKKNSVVIDAIDINGTAIANTKRIAERLGVQDLVRAWESDAFDAVANKYDFILFNAPIPVPSEIAVATKTQDENRFDWDAAFLKRVFAELHLHLTPTGKLLVMSHEDIKPYLPAHLCSRPRISFKVGFALAISEVVQRKEGLSDLFYAVTPTPDLILEF